MSRGKWSLIKQSKRFYVRTYRLTGSAIFLSMLLNLSLGLLIWASYFNRPDSDYYATSGVAPPIALISMDSPNDTSVALLPDDPVDDDFTRVIPQ